MKHGHCTRQAITPEYRSWRCMWNRCRNKKEKVWHLYGGRGITVCERWTSFATFLEDMGPKPTPQHSIDRIDNDAGYSPENCRWATRKKQQRNMRSNRTISFNGATRCIAEWAELLGINYLTLTARIKRGWPVERAFTSPIQLNQWAHLRDLSTSLQCQSPAN